MLIDFSKIDDSENTYELLNEGKHLLKVVSCESTKSSKGNEMWVLVLEDKDGNKVWDNIVYTDKTLGRIKKYFSNLGLDVSSEADYTPDDLVGLFFNAEVKVEDYTDKNGNTKQKNTIDIWRSEKYTAAKKTAPKKVVEESELPF